MIELAAASGVDVRIVQLLPNSEIAELFKSYRYYVLPSLHEGLPKSLIEAMSSEMICIGTNVPGISDLLSDEATGYLSDGLDEAAIAAAIDRARSDPAKVEVAKAARAYVAAHHSIRTYVERERQAIERWILPKISYRASRSIGL